MERFPPMPPSQLQGEAKALHDVMGEMAEKTFTDQPFKTKRPDGAMIGPFAPLLRTPKLARSFFNVATALAEIPGLPASARETAILVVGAQHGAGYEMYAHRAVAESSVALTTAQTGAIIAGRRPEGADKGVGVAYDVACALVGEKGNLRNELWEGAVGEFGVEGATALVHYVGFYAYTCMILNGFGVPVPDEEGTSS